MKIALISTVYNEGEDIFAWADSLRKQTRQPDEFVIVDGGSTDGTPERLRLAFSHGDFPAPRIITEKCNIARGRNLAFKHTTAEIVASIDAGSVAAENWLEKITGPFFENPGVPAVGGTSAADWTTSDSRPDTIGCRGVEGRPTQRSPACRPTRRAFRSAAASTRRIPRNAC